MLGDGCARLRPCSEREARAPGVCADPRVPRWRRRLDVRGRNGRCGARRRSLRLHRLDRSVLRREGVPDRRRRSRRTALRERRRRLRLRRRRRVRLDRLRIRLRLRRRRAHDHFFVQQRQDDVHRRNDRVRCFEHRLRVHDERVHHRRGLRVITPPGRGARRRSKASRSRASRAAASASLASRGPELLGRPTRGRRLGARG